ALAEATLAAGWLLAQEPLVERHGVPRDASGRFIPAVIVGLGKLGGRELVTGSDLDLFVVFAEAGATDGADRIDAHWFYSLAVEACGRVPAGASTATRGRARRAMRAPACGRGWSASSVARRAGAYT